MSKEVLGGFEHRVLLSTLHLEPDAFTAAIVTHLEEHTGRAVAPAAVYIALKRLERNGMVKSDTRKKDSGGETRLRRYFRVTPEGVRVLREERHALTSLWSGVESALEV